MALALIATGLFMVGVVGSMLWLTWLSLRQPEHSPLALRDAT